MLVAAYRASASDMVTQSSSIFSLGSKNEIFSLVLNLRKYKYSFFFTFKDSWLEINNLYIFLVLYPYANTLAMSYTRIQCCLPAKQLSNQVWFISVLQCTIEFQSVCKMEFSTSSKTCDKPKKYPKCKLLSRLENLINDLQNSRISRIAHLKMKLYWIIETYGNTSSCLAAVARRSS